MDKEKLPADKEEESQHRSRVGPSGQEEYSDATGSSDTGIVLNLTPLTNVDPAELGNFPGTSKTSPKSKKQPKKHHDKVRVESVPINICRVPSHERPSERHTERSSHNQHASAGYSVTFPHEKFLKGIQPMFSHFMDVLEPKSEDLCGVETWSQSEHDLVAELVSIVSEYVKKVLAQKPSEEKERVLEELDRSSPLRDLVEDNLPDLESQMRQLCIGGRKPISSTTPVKGKYYRSSTGRPLIADSTRSPRRSLDMSIDSAEDNSDEDDLSVAALQRHVESVSASMRRAQERAHAFAREASETERLKQLRREIIAEVYPRKNREPQPKELGPMRESAPVPCPGGKSTGNQPREIEPEENPKLNRYYERISNQIYHFWLNRYILANNVRVAKELKLLRLNSSQVTEKEIEMGMDAMTHGLSLIRDAHLGPRKPRVHQRTSQIVPNTVVQPEETVAPWKVTSTSPQITRPSVIVSAWQEAGKKPTAVAGTVDSLATSRHSRDLRVSQRTQSPSKKANPKRPNKLGKTRRSGSLSPRRTQQKSHRTFPDSGTNRESRPSAPADTRSGPGSKAHSDSDTNRRSGPTDKRKRSSESGECLGACGPMSGDAAESKWDWSILNDSELTNPSNQRTLIDLETRDIVPSGTLAPAESPSPSPSQLPNVSRSFSVFVDTTPLDELPDPRGMPLGRFFPEENMLEFKHVTSRWIEIVRLGTSAIAQAEEVITVTRHESALQTLWKALQRERGDQRVQEIRRIFEENPFLKWAFGLRFTQLTEFRNVSGPDKKKMTSL